MLDPPQSASSSSFGIDSLLASSDLPSTSWLDHEPSFRRKPPQQPIINPSLAASTPVKSLMLVSTASAGMSARVYFSPLHFSISRKFWIHFPLRSTGMASSHPAVPLNTSLRSSFSPDMMGASLPKISHKDASLDETCLLLSFLGTNSSMLISASSKNFTDSGIFPLFGLPKCSLGTLSSSRSPSGNQANPPTPMESPSLETFGDGGNPEYVQLLQTRPILEKTSSASLVRLRHSSKLLLESIKSSTYLLKMRNRASSGNSSLIRFASSDKANSDWAETHLTP